MISAIEFGERYFSCPPAMEARISLGPGATQADWWRACDRGDWLIWQLERVGMDRDNPALARALDRIRARAIRRAQRVLRGVRAPWATAWRRWARRWLSGEDRRREAAWAAAEATWAAGVAAEAAGVAWATAWAAWAAAWAAEAAAWAAAEAAEVAWAAELRLQARDIHHEIPEWPGEEGSC